MQEKKQLPLKNEKMQLESSENLKKNDTPSIEKKLFCIRIIINIIFSLILVATFCLLWTSYSPAWKIFFFITVWSFWSNTFYIITITVVDILLYKEYKKCEKFNSFIRNDLIRIIFPFSISTIVIYWELVLLGDKYQEIGHSLLDICKSFFLHGLVFVFMCFDIFTSKHINKKNNCKRDIIIISIIMAVHFALVILCKEVLNIYSYDYLIIADVRQIIASFIILYILVLNGYIVLYLISDNFFIKEDVEQNYNKMDKDEDSENILKHNDDSNVCALNKINNKYAKSSNNNIESNIENRNNEIKKDSIVEDKKEDNKSDIKNSESDNYDISDKVSNKNNEFDNNAENYGTDFIQINTINQAKKIAEDRKLLNLKKRKFGIKDIKIPKNNVVQIKK